MAPSVRSRPGSEQEDEDHCELRGDRKTRKPLVEKKRRARINESLHDLRLILADTELQAKMENAEVLELTVKRVQGILQRRSAESDKMQREASERFAAGYIQCMHEVHTFVSSCPGIDATVAAELLNHLLESMPLNEGSFQDLIVEVLSEDSGSESLSPDVSLNTSAFSPSPCSEDGCSDLEETESDRSLLSPSPQDPGRTADMPSTSHTKCMWRPW
ncbi:transcription cofactor HES-6 [Ambystoma mexicanum]|uniref:transcription cofactor HES-6 n=1 Tax=Ambystoma mexicanum TaxID=8296 RepID=UPI0037E77BBF